MFTLTDVKFNSINNKAKRIYYTGFEYLTMRLTKFNRNIHITQRDRSDRVSILPRLRLVPLDTEVLFEKMLVEHRFGRPIIHVTTPRNIDSDHDMCSANYTQSYSRSIVCLMKVCFTSFITTCT